MSLLRRAVAGVLGGLATSIAALLAVLLIAWGRCDGASGENCDVGLAVTSLAFVPVFFAAAVLLLFSSEASGLLLNNFLIVLALFVGLLPLALLSGQEWWSLLIFGGLLSLLVGYVIVPQRETPQQGASDRRQPHDAQRPIPSRTAGEALEEMQFWAEQVKSKTADFRRRIRALRQR